MTHSFTRTFTASLLTLTALSLASPALAQGGGGGGGGGGSGGGGGGGSSQPTMSYPSSTMQQDRLQTPDQMRDQDRTRDPDIDRDRDRLRDPDQNRLRDPDADRDRDRLRNPDFDRDRDRDRDRLYINQVVDGQLSSWQLLTSAERQKFSTAMRSASSQQERDRIRAEHQSTVQARARDLGVDAPFGPQRIGAGTRRSYSLIQMLSDQERLQFHQRMNEAATAEERSRIRNEMQVVTRERAMEMGVDVPAWFGQTPTD